MNTNCEAFIKFKLLKVEVHDHDNDCDKFPLEVHINYNHNHSVHSASAFKYHCVSQDTKQQFENLFKEGHSASSAYSEYKNCLKSQLEPKEFIRVLADRSIMPDYRYILDERVKKSVKYFNKKMRKMLTGTTQALQKINYSLGQELSSVVGKGKKRKIGRNINVQPTALARRTFPSKGKSAARHGRPLVGLRQWQEI